MARVLVLFAHPRLEKSRANRALIQRLPEGLVTFHDLYERYPDFEIDIAAEQALLSDHDTIVWHHPFYWYSMPPLAKAWIDLVLAFGWAYGPGGTALKGKRTVPCCKPSSISRPPSCACPWPRNWAWDRCSAT